MQATPGPPGTPLRVSGAITATFPATAEQGCRIGRGTSSNDLAFTFSRSPAGPPVEEIGGPPYELDFSVPNYSSVGSYEHVRAAVRTEMGDQLVWATTEGHVLVNSDDSNLIHGMISAELLLRPRDPMQLPRPSASLSSPATLTGAWQCAVKP